MQYPEKVESKEYPGFYLVPGFKHTYINTAGNVIDHKRNYCPLPELVEWGYLKIYSESVTIFVHRLLALTFLPVPELPVEELQVNHIDGVKINNALDNLEWVTRSGNCLHAYQTGLRDDNVPVLVKDLRDGSIVRYYSLHECARAFNVDVFTVHSHLKSYNLEKISWKYYSLIREGQPWPDIDPADIGKHRNGDAKTVVAITVDKKTAIVFESTTEAAQHFGWKSGTLAMHMWRHGSKPRNGYTFWFMNDDKIYNRQGEVFTSVVDIVGGPTC
jgi:hypothetical protein